MECKNFSNVILKLDGNTARAINKFVKHTNNTSFVVEQEEQLPAKNNPSKIIFPFNQTDIRSNWMIGNAHYLSNQLQGRKRLANQSLRKTLDGILSETNNYYNNNNESISKSIFFDTSNINNLTYKRHHLLYNEKFNRSFNDSFEKHSKIINNQQTKETKENREKNYYNKKPNEYYANKGDFIDKDKYVKAVTNKNLNTNKSNNPNNSNIIDFNTDTSLLNGDYARKFKRFTNITSFNKIFFTPRDNTEQNKQNNKKLTLLFTRSKGPQITYLWEKDQTPLYKPRESKYNGWVTKDSDIFKPKIERFMTKRKLTKSVDLTGFRKLVEYAGLKYKQSHQYDEVDYYNNENQK